MERDQDLITRRYEQLKDAWIQRAARAYSWTTEYATQRFYKIDPYCPYCLAENFYGDCIKCGWCRAGASNDQ
jgi:hypothetical protein